MDALESCTDFGIRERAPLPGANYFAFTDAAGGTGKDAFSVCVSHREPNGLVVIDFLRERLPRFVPAEVVKEFAAILKLYKITTVSGDRYSSGWNADEWARAGLTYRPSKLTKSELYLAALPMLLSQQVRLLDSEKMRKQFVGLERRVHSNGRESVDDSGGSSNDDLANCLSGAMWLASDAPAPMTFHNPDVASFEQPSYARSFGMVGSHDLYIGAGGRPGGAPSVENEHRREEARRRMNGD
jgi:hypothetical protein